MESPYLKNIILFLLVIVSLVFHSYNLSHASYELDEAVHVWFAQMPYSDVVEQASNDPNPPVYNLIISAWVKAFGVSEFSTRFFSVLMGVLAVVAMFLMASRNFGLTVGIVAALFLCFSPIQFRFTHLARPYSMLMLTVILSYGALFEAIKKPTGKRLLVYYILSTLMIYVHPTSVFNILAQGLMVLVDARKDYKKLLKFSLTMVAAVATFGIWVVSIPYFERDDAMWFGPPNWDNIYHVIRSFYGSTNLVLLQLGALFVAGVMAIRNREFVSKISLFNLMIWLIVPAIISICFSHLVKPVFQDKYILSVQPAAMLLLALSIYHTGKWLRIPFYLCSFVFLAQVTELKPKSEDDWKSAVEYVVAKHDENSAILIDPWYEFRTFAFYFDRHAYEIPDSTYKILISKRVFTSWDDVFDSETGTPKADVVHLMIGHEGYVVPAVTSETLESVATHIATEQYAGVAIKSYSFLSSMDTMALQRFDYSAEKEGVKHVGKHEEFPAAYVVPLHDAKSNRLAHVIATIDVVAGNALDGVNFVVAAERPDGSFLLYESLAVKSELEKMGDSRTITISSMVRRFDENVVVKVYLWNSNHAEMVIDNFEVVVKN